MRMINKSNSNVPTFLRYLSMCSDAILNAHKCPKNSMSQIIIFTSYGRGNEA